MPQRSPKVSDCLLIHGGIDCLQIGYILSYWKLPEGEHIFMVGHPLFIRGLPAGHDKPSLCKKSACIFLPGTARARSPETRLTEAPLIEYH